jgi:hypothetical protein
MTGGVFDLYTRTKNVKLCHPIHHVPLAFKRRQPGELHAPSPVVLHIRLSPHPRPRRSLSPSPHLNSFILAVTLHHFISPLISILQLFVPPPSCCPSPSPSLRQTSAGCRGPTPNQSSCHSRFSPSCIIHCTKPHHTVPLRSALCPPCDSSLTLFFLFVLL